VAEVERQSRRSVRRVLASPGEIQRYTVEFFALAKSVRAAQKAGGNAGGASFEQLVELGRSNKQLDANDQGVVQVVDWLWQYAFDQRASDIHLEPRREQGTIRFRIDGVLHPVYQMPIGVLNAMTARIKLLGRMDVIEKRRPQDGRIKTRNTRGDEIEMRLSTLPTAFGEKMVMRIFDPDTTVKDLDALGFSAHDAERWEALVKRPHGIVLVTGPTGSGKTTTLYSTLRRLATDAVNVSTVEDPIEMIEPAFNQTQVQPQLDFGFTEGLARADAPGPGHHHGGRDPRPEDGRDGGAGGADRAPGVQHPAHQRRAERHHARHGARRAALPDQRHGAGCAGPAAGAHPVPAMQDAGRSSTRADLEAVVKPWKINGGYRPYKAVGCVDCRMTGFMGRMGLYELLTVSEAFKDKVNQQPSIDALRRQAVADGMRPLRLAGALRVAEGLTTLDEVLLATPPVE
jgi:general secretion pathway protein E